MDRSDPEERSALAACVDAQRAFHALSGLATAKRIAGISLYLQATQPLNREAALSIAAQTFECCPGPSRGGLKKAASEARAILEFGAASYLPADVAMLPEQDLLAAIASAVGRVKLREVTRARAAALAGGRGGRPTARPTIAYAAMRKLLSLVARGDAAAKAELSAIQDLMGRLREAEQPAPNL